MSVFFDPFRSLTNEPFGQNFGSALLAGGSTGIPGLLSLWNAKTPSTSPVGPQIQTSVAGNQPDASGNMVPWPVNHPGRGVMVQPAYSNLLQNPKFEGAVSGSPGTGPTNWILVFGDGALVLDGTDLTFSVTAGRRFYRQPITIGTNTTYRCGIKINVANETTFSQLLNIVDVIANSSRSYMLDGVSALTSTVVTVGEHYLEMLFTTTDTGGTISFRFGVGVTNVATLSATFCCPQFVASAYRMPYAASGAGATVSVPSTAGDDDPENGMAFLMDSRITAALSAGGRFTAAALVYMGVSSAEVTADTNIISINDSITGGIYAAAGGVLKASDGTNTATVTVADGWARGETLFIPWWINGAGTNQQVGYKKSAESAITWGAAADYDGSVNPGAHLRWGYTIDKPIGAIQSQVWGKSVGTDAEMLALLRYAA